MTQSSNMSSNNNPHHHHHQHILTIPQPFAFQQSRVVPSSKNKKTHFVSLIHPQKALSELAEEDSNQNTTEGDTGSTVETNNNNNNTLTKTATSATKDVENKKSIGNLRKQSDTAAVIKKENDQENNDDADMVEIDTALLKIKKKEVSELKRKKKLKMRALKKLKQAIADTASSSALGLATGEDPDLFGLKSSKIKITEDGGYTHDDEAPLEWESDDDDNDKNLEGKELESDKESEDEEENDSGEPDKKKSKSLLVDFEKKEVKNKRVMNMWFTKDIFKGMDEDITDPELSLAAKRYKVDEDEKPAEEQNKDSKKEDFDEKFPEDEDFSDPDDYGTV